MLIAPKVCYLSILEVLVNQPAPHCQLLNCERVGVTGRHGFLSLQNSNAQFRILEPHDIAPCDSL